MALLLLGGVVFPALVGVVVFLSLHAVVKWGVGEATKVLSPKAATRILVDRP
ncbi:hypothetical protein MYCTH_2307564 [Thermothelomyces thermophilus ATCC 42464]|uniref:Uncharacterized protein n=1 Tax=Thermothelomyces thermophilus (strain ATCC 42464 / BCRC 31852 / DSM 1799) TaxID=573729 RepID=G2QG79_THET4|nr:uncharacterized protein MYCTH_2307564 [Thermothelomyces thermophilus ATCC 42464]AEO59339.1 hypothetical protein MYCTH_2307564 [Thermothelomyces thermophilus ATCC 42464]